MIKADKTNHSSNQTHFPDPFWIKIIYFSSMAAIAQNDLKIASFHKFSTSKPSIVSSKTLCFRFKCCSSQNHGNILRNNSNNGAQKAVKTFVPYIFNDQTNDINSGIFCKDNKNQILPEKLMVAVDVDEVLGNFVSALNRFIADRYSSNHSISEYNVYEFFRIWNCSRDEANNRVHEFFKTPYFEKGILPIPGAQKTLQKLTIFCNLCIVTSRQNAIKSHTLEWIEKHYPGLFQEIHFGNHFALDGLSRPKSEICKSLGAKVLIDDNPTYAIECAEMGIKVLLFDYENSYPWCKIEHVCEHPLVTKVHNWEEVEQELAAWVLS